MLSSSFRFAAVGLVNTGIGYGAIVVAKAWGGLSDLAANLMGYVLGLCVSFLLNRSWTFASRRARRGGLARFVVSFLVAYLLNLAILYVARDGMALSAYFAQMLAVLGYATAFFLLSNYYVFKQSQHPAEEGK